MKIKVGDYVRVSATQAEAINSSNIYSCWNAKSEKFSKEVSGEDGCEEMKVATKKKK